MAKKQVNKRRKFQVPINRFCRFTKAGVKEIDYKDVEILLKLSCLNSSPKPSIVLSAIAITASGVESLPVKPVPPVDIMTSIRGSFVRSRNVCLINSTSSLIINLFLTEWPKVVMRSFSRFPDSSSFSERESEIVIKAMLIDTNFTDMSMLVIKNYK